MSISNLQSNTNMSRVLSMASILLGATLTLTACGGDDHEVKAVDKVEEAAELARQNAPEHEPLAPEDIAPVESSETTDTEDGADSEEATTADSESGEEATTTADSATEEATDTAAEVVDTAQEEAEVAQ